MSYQGIRVRVIEVVKYCSLGGLHPLSQDCVYVVIIQEISINIANVQVLLAIYYNYYFRKFSPLTINALSSSYF